jgi:hypothetical protein
MELDQPKDGNEIGDPKRKKSPKRKDEGGLHTARNGVFSRGVLEALRRSGENVRQLRKVERGLRDALRPVGPLGEFFFDRFWSSALRLVLASRLEGGRLALKPKTGSDAQSSIPAPFAAFLPALTQDEGNPCVPATISGPIHELSLIARYDRAAGREMYRALSILFILRDERDDSGLKDWAAAMAGIGSNQ